MTQGTGSVPEIGRASASRRGGALPSVVEFLRRMLERRLDRDGQAPALEPHLLPEDEVAPAGAGRRDRRLGLPEEILDRSLAQKILHGWLQNRHQVLVPLTFRMTRLAPEDAAMMLRFTAVSVRTATSADDPARNFAERWLGEIGAKPEHVAIFRDALVEAPSLDRLLASVRDRELAPYAYAAAVAAIDTREPAARLFASFIAARLGLPADAVRSVDRRYRR